MMILTISLSLRAGCDTQIATIRPIPANKLKVIPRIFIGIFPLFFCGLLFAQSPSAATKAESRLLTVEGQVQVMPVGTTTWTQGETNQLLRLGDRLRTGPRSRATVRLSDLTVLRVNELTTLQIRPPQQPGKQSLLDLNSGSAYFLSREKPAEQEFRTPLTSGAIRGTEFNLAVADDGRTVVTLMDGQVTLSNPLGQLDMNSGDQGLVEPGRPPVKTAMIEAVNIIQWCLYYPGVLDADELDLTPGERQSLAASLSAYYSGDLLQAVAQYPADRQPASPSERVYRAAILLSVGQVEQAGTLLAYLSTNASDRPARLAAALREMIAAVKNQPGPRAAAPALATEWLAESYYLQAHARLADALAAARNAVVRSTNFGFGWARVAELELSFGRIPAAQAALNRSLQISPRNPQSLAVKGFMLAARYQPAAAQAAFAEAIALDGALGNAWLGQGLGRIAQGQAQAGLRDLQVAAVLEPQRSVLRSYLGKAFSNGGDDPRAQKELGLAQRLDPNDPTSWLYSALVNQQEDQINQGVRDLEKSEQLNDNRRLFRSRLLLDEDQAVRSANLANIYQDAGMFDWSVREASRAVDLDYANYSAHQFLANSYDALRDPNVINLRYETPWFGELLLTELLAPVGADNLSEYISEREYSPLFERNHFGVSSSTQYSSHGDWLERASQYGTYDTVTYAIDTEYRSAPGWRPNNDTEQLTISTKGKDQITPQDSIFIEGVYANYRFGDTAQYYNQYGALANAPAPSATFRGDERQEPSIYVGYHHEWEPGIHTLFLAAHLNDTLRLNDPANFNIPYTIAGGGGPVILPTSLLLPAGFGTSYQRESDYYTTDLQQIWQNERQTLVAGARYQIGWNSTESSVMENPAVPVSQQDLTTTLQRVAFYAYETFKVCEQLELTGGVAYDRLHFPRDIDTQPITGAEADTDQVSPKAGVIWSPTPETHLRAAYTRSLGGAFIDSSVRLEPVQIAGFTQAFRSIAPESLIGTVPGSRFTTYGVGLDRSFKSNTYLSVEGELLKSDGERTIGLVNNGGPDFPGNTPQTLHYREESLRVSLDQLVGREVTLGARYQLSHAELMGWLNDISSAVPQNSSAVLQQLSLYLNYNLPCGFFSQGEALWTTQDNLRDQAGLVDANFWQLNAFAGYRFLHRAAEVKAGVLNINNANYLLNPINLYNDLPRRRVFTVNFKFYF
jgi:Tfp pilus assembly protein PilF